MQHVFSIIYLHNIPPPLLLPLSTPAAASNTTFSLLARFFVKRNKSRYCYDFTGSEQNKRRQNVREETIKKMWILSWKHLTFFCACWLLCCVAGWLDDENVVVVVVAIAALNMKRRCRNSSNKKDDIIFPFLWCNGRRDCWWISNSI